MRERRGERGWVRCTGACGSATALEPMIRLSLGVLVMAAAVAETRATGHNPDPSCITPRVSRWIAIPDSAWPQLVHRPGDQAWAHLEPAALPRESATWCNPLQDDRAALQDGRRLYLEFCASCHGAQGRGDGPGAAVADPPPYAFTRPEFAGMLEPPGPALLYAVLARGIDCTTMRPFRDLGGWERLAVIAYVTQLPGPEAVANRRGWADTLRARHPR